MFEPEVGIRFKTESSKISERNNSETILRQAITLIELTFSRLVNFQKPPKLVVSQKPTDFSQTFHFPYLEQ